MAKSDKWWNGTWKSIRENHSSRMKRALQRFGDISFKHFGDDDQFANWNLVGGLVAINFLFSLIYWVANIIPTDEL